MAREYLGESLERGADGVQAFPVILTRSALNSLAGTSGIKVGQVYLISDEGYHPVTGVATNAVGEQRFVHFGETAPSDTFKIWFDVT